MSGRKGRRSSVLSQEQQDSLERRLQSRPAETAPTRSSALAATAKRLERSLVSDKLNADLYAREEQGIPGNHILRSSNVAPGLRATKIKLERSITRDTVGHLLEGRPEYDELVKAGITAPDKRATKLQRLSRQLERSMTEDKVSHLLEARSNAADLENKAVLKDTKVAPAVQSAQMELQKNLARSNLYHALKYRPSIVELQERGVYPQYGDYYDDDDEGDYNEEDYYDEYDGMMEEEYYDEDDVEEEEANYSRRSKNFHLTRILLKFVAAMGEAGEISVQQKGVLKDLIVDQDQTTLAVAETFDAEDDLHDFKDSLVRLSMMRR